jgi:hypothetical protein
LRWLIFFIYNHVTPAGLRWLTFFHLQSCHPCGVTMVDIFFGYNHVTPAGLLKHMPAFEARRADMIITKARKHSQQNPEGVT